MKVTEHKLGNVYTMVNKDGSKSEGWKIAYIPLTGTYQSGEWVDFYKPRALIERPIKDGIDFREVPIKYLTISK